MGKHKKSLEEYFTHPHRLPLREAHVHYIEGQCQCGPVFLNGEWWHKRMWGKSKGYVQVVNKPKRRKAGGE